MDTLLAFLAVLTTLTLASAVRRVPAGKAYTLRRGGKVVRVLPEGTHFIRPWFERVGHKIDLNGHTLRIERPLAGGDARATVYWQVLEPAQADAVLDKVDELIRRGAEETLAAEPAADGHNLGQRIKQRLNGALRERGMLVTRVEFDRS